MLLQAEGTSRRVQRWKHPQPGLLRLNVDGAVTVVDAIGRWSYVIRDELSEIVQLGAGCLNFACNPLHMELKSMHTGYQTTSAHF